MIMHSRGDELIGFHHAERNFQAAREPKILWEIHGGHVDPIGANPALFREGIERFIDQLVLPRSQNISQ